MHAHHQAIPDTAISGVVTRATSPSAANRIFEHADPKREVTKFLEDEDDAGLEPLEPDPKLPKVMVGRRHSNLVPKTEAGHQSDALPPPPKTNPTLYPKRNSLSGESDAIPPDMSRLGKTRSVGFSIDGGDDTLESDAKARSGLARSASTSSSGFSPNGFSVTKSIMMKSFSFSKRKEEDSASRQKSRSLNSAASFASSIDEDDILSDEELSIDRVPSEVNMNLPHLSRSPSLHRRLWGQEIRNRDTVVATSDINHRKFIMNPDGVFRRRWNIIAMAFILYTSIELPMNLAFVDCHSIEEPLFWVGVLCDLFFIIDLAINFFTGYKEDGQLIMTPSRIRRHYLHSTAFKFDFISTLPVDYVTIQSSCKSYTKATKVFRSIRVVRLFRLFRIQRLFRYSSNITEQFSAGMSRVLKLVMMLLFFSHWNACMLFLVGKSADSDDSWVAQQGIENSDISVQYTWSMFASLSQMLCIGYGAHEPRLPSEAWMTIWSMTSGAALFSGIMGSITAVLLSLDSSGQKYVSHMDEVEAFMTRREVPPELRHRIRSYMKLRYTGQEEREDDDGDDGPKKVPRMYSEEGIIDELSVGIKRDLHLHLTQGLIQKLPFLSGMDLPPTVSTFLSSVLQWQLAIANDVVMEQEDPPEKICFIQSGNVVLVRDAARLTELSDGSYFGELPFTHKETIKLQPMSAVVEKKVCEYHILSAAHVIELFHHFPEVEDVMRLVATQRVTRLELNGEVALEKASESYTRQARLHSARNRHRRNTITRLFETSPAEMMAKAHETKSDFSLLRKSETTETTHKRERSQSDSSAIVHHDSAPSKLCTVPDSPFVSEGRPDPGSGGTRKAGVELPNDIYAGGGDVDL